VSRLYLQLSTPAKRAWLFVFTGIAAFYLWGLGSLPLVGPDEPRYAQVAREMLARRDFITPTLGGLPWFEKPPLLYWMMMLSYRVLGVNEYAARLGPAICGLLTAVFVYLLGAAIDEAQDNTASSSSSYGRWCALVWLSSLGGIGFSRGATFDIVLTMTITGAFAFWFQHEAKSGEGKTAAASLVGFYFFSGLSLLAKGLIGPVIIFGVIGVYFLLRREWPRRQFLLSLVWGVPLAVAIAATWYLPMIARHGWLFIDQFIIQHHFARFATNKYHHPAPFYFYVPVLIALALPWTIALGASLLATKRWNWRGSAPIDRMRVSALAWLVMPIVFFSISNSKLGGYILPVLPAVALLAGERIACFWKEQRGEKVLRLTGGLLIAMAFAAVWYTHRETELTLSAAVLATLPLFLTGLLALVRARRWLFGGIAMATFVTAIVSLSLAGPSMARSQSVRDLLATAAARGYGATPVVQLHTIERTAEFYAAGRITYGSDGEPIKFEGVLQVVEAAQRNGGTVLCLIPSEYASQLIGFQQARSELIGDNGRVALILVRVN
jgi:4-amino-4-deoxy-L-arabinose transferase-like glycosyltransferase